MNFEQWRSLLQANDAAIHQISVDTQDEATRLFKEKMEICGCRVPYDHIVSQIISMARTGAWYAVINDELVGVYIGGSANIEWASSDLEWHDVVESSADI